jgi:hypothetical protein
MSFMARSLTLHAAAAVLLIASAAQAQGGAGVDCSAVLSRARGRPPREVAVGDLTSLQSCGGAGREMLASLVRGAAAEANHDVLMHLVGAATTYDPVLFAASADLVSNRAATRPARVAGFRLLLHQVRGPGSQFVILNRAVRGTIEPEAFVDASSGCGIIGGEEGSPALLSQLVSAAGRLSTDADPVVRNLARCIDEKLGPPPEARLAPGDVSLRPLCSLTLSVRTTSPRRVTLDWAVAGTQARGVVSIDTGQPTHLSVDEPGQVVLSYQGRELARARTIGTACPF